MTDARSQPEETTTAGQNSDTFPVVVRLVWEPFGEAAEKVVDELIRQSRWTTKGPKAIKYRVVVASFLKAVQQVYSRQSRNKNDKNHKNDVPYLGIRWRNEAWSVYPMVGKDVANSVIRELLRQFDAKQVAGSGNSNLVKDEQGKWSTGPKMSMYEIDLSKAAELSTLRFIETGLPHIKLNKVESRQQKMPEKLTKRPSHS